MIRKTIATVTTASLVPELFVKFTLCLSCWHRSTLNLGLIWQRKFVCMHNEYSVCSPVLISYNRVNGRHVSEDPFLLKNILRDEWKFDGAVCSFSVFANHTNVVSLDCERLVGLFPPDFLLFLHHASTLGLEPIALIRHITPAST